MSSARIAAAPGAGAATCSRKGSTRLSRCATGGILVSQASASPMIPMRCSLGIDDSQGGNVRAVPVRAGRRTLLGICKILRSNGLSRHTTGGDGVVRVQSQINLSVKITVFVADQHGIRKTQIVSNEEVRIAQVNRNIEDDVGDIRFARS